MEKILTNILFSLLSKAMEHLIIRKYNGTVLHQNFLKWKEEWKVTHSTSSDMASASQSIQDQIDNYKKN